MLKYIMIKCNNKIKLENREIKNEKEYSVGKTGEIKTDIPISFFVKEENKKLKINIDGKIIFLDLNETYEINDEIELSFYDSKEKLASEKYGKKIEIELSKVLSPKELFEKILSLFQKFTKGILDNSGIFLVNENTVKVPEIFYNKIPSNFKSFSTSKLKEVIKKKEAIFAKISLRERKGSLVGKQYCACIPIYDKANNLIAIIYGSSIRDTDFKDEEKKFCKELANISKKKLEEMMYPNDKLKDIIWHYDKYFINTLYKISRSNEAVLILGESGTGKESHANIIHNFSKRKKNKFFSINCAALTEELILSELFGHVKGAFTGAYKDKTGFFELANGGTIFLDEIAELSLYCQSKILRFLEEKKFFKLGGTEELSSDVRIITATNKDLEKMIEEGSFREDLYYRIAVIPFILKPLRENKEKIKTLANFILKNFLNKNKDIVSYTFDESAIDFLKSYPWHGNIRELQNFIKSFSINRDSESNVANKMEIEEFVKKSISVLKKQKKIFLKEFNAENDNIDDAIKPLEETLKSIKKYEVEKAMRISKNNKAEASRLLDINIKTLDKIIKET